MMYLGDQNCLFMHMCLTFAGSEIKGDKPHISLETATTGRAEKWVIYMPTEQWGSNLHASCSAFQPRQHIKTKRKRRSEGRGEEGKGEK